MCSHMELTLHWGLNPKLLVRAAVHNHTERNALVSENLGAGK